MDTARQAVQSNPLDHPGQTSCLINLGDRLGVDTSGLKSTMIWKKCRECYLGAFGCIFAIPLHRAVATGLCLTNLAHLGRIRESIELSRGALTLLPTLHTRILDRNDQEFVLSGFPGIASDLFKLLIAESRAHEAVECLEQGRANITSQQPNDRSDVQDPWVCAQPDKA